MTRHVTSDIVPFETADARHVGGPSDAVWRERGDARHSSRTSGRRRSTTTAVVCFVAMLALLVVSVGCRGRETASREAGHEAKPAGAAASGAAPKADHDDADADRLELEADTMRDLRITIAAVETRTAADTLTLLGELGVNEEAYAEVSTPLAARVTRLLVGTGDVVAVNQPVAVLQSREIGEAVGALHAATARVTLARQALERRRTLAAERITPQRSVEEAEAELIAADAAERAARASLEALGVAAPQSSATASGAGAPAPKRPDADTRASDSRKHPDAADGSGLVLRSPVAGTVLERSAAIGQLADPAKPLFRIAHLGTLWLTVHAFERDAVRLAPGAATRVTLTALPGETFAGTIARVGQQVDASSRTLAIRIDLPNPRHRLKPGMSAAAAVPLGTEGRPVLTVPGAALQRVGQRWCVFVPEVFVSGQPARFRIRTVARGRELDGEIEILDGLTAADRVVSEGAFVLKAELDKRAGSGDAHAH